MENLWGNSQRTWAKIFLVAAVGFALLVSSRAAAVEEDEGSRLAEREASLFLNGEAVEFDSPLQYRDDKLMVPVRHVFEAMGYEVFWEGEAKRVTLYNGERLVFFYLDDPLYAVNGSVHRAAMPPFIAEERTVVGLDFLQKAAALEKLSWDEEKGVLHIESAEAEETEPPLDPLPGEYEKFLIGIISSEEKVEEGDLFQITVNAPAVKGIFSYELFLNFDPGLLEVERVYNPSFDSSEELYLKEINNREGKARYTQTILGYRENVSPREHLAAFEVRARGEGRLYLEELLELTLKDNEAEAIPFLMENREVRVGND